MADVEPDQPLIDDADMCPCGRGEEEFLHYDMHPPYRMTPPMAWRCKACDDEYDGRTIVQYGEKAKHNPAEVTI